MPDDAQQTDSHVMNTYARLPVAFTRGEGAYLFDADGKRYLDGLTGLAVCGLGHAHPRVTEAIASQAAGLLHTSNLYQIPLQERLAERLCELSGMEKVFFGNSGAEANEAAIKLARPVQTTNHHRIETCVAHQSLGDRDGLCIVTGDLLQQLRCLHVLQQVVAKKRDGVHRLFFHSG